MTDEMDSVRLSDMMTDVADTARISMLADKAGADIARALNDHSETVTELAEQVFQLVEHRPVVFGIGAAMHVLMRIIDGLAKDKSSEKSEQAEDRRVLLLALCTMMYATLEAPDE